LELFKDVIRNPDKALYFDAGPEPRKAYFESLSKSAEEPDNP
jgi:hypothetical protein